MKKLRKLKELTQKKKHYAIGSALRIGNKFGLRLKASSSIYIFVYFVSALNATKYFVFYFFARQWEFRDNTVRVLAIITFSNKKKPPKTVV